VYKSLQVAFVALILFVFVFVFVFCCVFCWLFEVVVVVCRLLRPTSDLFDLLFVGCLFLLLNVVVFVLLVFYQSLLLFFFLVFNV